MVTSDAGGRATRTLFAESMNVLALKHGCSAWCLGALIALPSCHPHPAPASGAGATASANGVSHSGDKFPRCTLTPRRRARRSGVVRRARHPRSCNHPNKCPKTRFLPQQMSKCVLAINSINFAFFLIRTPLLVVRYLYK